jgi:uncharacterized repeat protein (TIGR01451 family)
MMSFSIEGLQRSNEPGRGRSAPRGRISTHVTTLRIALLLTALGAASAALSETVDFAVFISEGGVPVTGGSIVYAPVVTADRWTDAQEPFTVRLTVPPELEITSFCSDTATFDAAARVLTWTDRLDNPFVALESCPLTFRVAPTAAPGSTLSLTATLTTSAPDPNPGNNTAVYTSVVRASADLAVSSSVDLLRYKPGATVTYTFTVANHGPQDAHDVVLIDQLSPLVTFVSFEQTGGPAALVGSAPNETGFDCSSPRCGTYMEADIPLLPNGSTATFRLVVKAKTSFEAADISNRLLVLSSSIDPSERDNDRFLWTFAGPNADLAITSTAAADGTVTIDVSNNGPETVHNVIVNNNLSDTATFLRATPSQGTCSAPVLTELIGSPPPLPFWTVDCSLGALAPGARATIVFAIEGLPFRLGSTVTPLQNDPAPANNQTLTFPLTRRRAMR